jgi:cytochrome c553
MARLLVALLLIASFARAENAADLANGEMLYLSCSTCHGDRGEGRFPMDAPSVAGLPAWYTEEQLEKYRNGQTGDHPDDIYGRQMALFGKALPDAASIRDVAAFIAAMPRVPARPSIAGDAARGRALYRTCVACHGDGYTGTPALHAPGLAGLDDWYLARQLANYRDGLRGYDDADIFGQQMRSAMAVLPDEQAIRDVVAYIGTLVPQARRTSSNPGARRALFGDLHVHTRFSVDAFVFGAVGLPDDAYRFGKGEPIPHASGKAIRIDRPLDFMAVTDHAEYMGVFVRMANPQDPLSQLTLARELHSDDPEAVARAGGKIRDSIFSNRPIPELIRDETITSVWQEIIDTAERHYEPGHFTTFIAFEWTATPDGANLHRNVVFRGGPDRVPPRPFSAQSSPEPADLWDYLEQARLSGDDVIAIPHNSNLSDGRMFPTVEGMQKAEAARRAANEPLAEIVQIKGSSETHPILSPTDEWSDFELLQELMFGANRDGAVRGSYLREAYLNGLVIDQRLGVNPYRFGLIGSTDSHNASTPVDEGHYTGKLGRGDATPESRRSGTTITPEIIKYSAAGLAGVWAEENARESIFAALRRGETFGTSGPRIRLRLFAGWDLAADVLDEQHRMASAYAHATPMGGELAGRPGDSKPTLVVHATRDPDGAPLDRLQIIKGWLENGEPREALVDVACSDGAAPDAKSHRCPPSGARVNLDDCSVSADRGDAELGAIWADPDFHPETPAFYYARVLENPTCRWSTWDALRMGWELSDAVPPIIQERAWSSPIWYDPDSLTEG